MPLYNPTFPRSLFRSNIAFILPSSGSMGDNGALTLTVALAHVYTPAYVYLPANAIVAGSAAGWYYTTFASTTLGTVFNHTYDPTVGGVPTVHASPTAFATTGPGAYTAVVTAQQGPSYPMPANTLGAGSKARVSWMVRVPTAANSKLLTLRAGTSSLPGAIVFNNGTGGTGFSPIDCVAANKQTAGFVASGTGLTIGGAAIFAVDMTAAQMMNPLMQIINAGTEYMALLAYEVIQDA